MQRSGVPTVQWGQLSQFGQEQVVAYLDQTLHQGEGKALGTAESLLRLHGDLLCSVFSGPPGHSVRVLAIGARRWLLRYRSSEWASNLGDEGDIEVRELGPQERPAWEGAVDAQLSPIWGVDLVANSAAAAWITGEWAHDTQVPWSELLACDLNLAPGIQGTGLHMTLGGAVATALSEPGVTRPWSAPQWPD